MTYLSITITSSSCTENYTSWRYSGSYFNRIASENDQDEINKDKKNDTSHDTNRDNKWKTSLANEAFLSVWHTIMRCINFNWKQTQKQSRQGRWRELQELRNEQSELNNKIEYLITQHSNPFNFIEMLQNRHNSFFNTFENTTPAVYTSLNMAYLNQIAHRIVSSSRSV